MRIYGHRGAAGTALENSRASVEASLAQPQLDAIEFDVHKTADGKLVVIHDHHTGRVSGEKLSVHDLTLAELQSIALKNGQPMLSLDELLAIVGAQKIVIIDIKDPGCADELVRELKLHPECSVMTGSFEHDNIKRLRELRPDIPTYVLEHYRPFHIVTSARQLGANGIGINKRLMNPLTYWLARRHGLEVSVYTVNSRWLAKIYGLLYPGISVFTDHAERF